MRGASLPGHYLRFASEAMACRFEVWLKPADRDALPAVRAGFEEVRTIDRRLSLFRTESELTMLNAAAHEGPVAVAEDLFDLLQLAQHIARLSDGAYDVTSGALSRCWGLLERRPRVPLPDALERARRLMGWGRVHLDERAHTVEFDTPGIELNLGSLGKGYALERLAARLSRSGVRDFMAHAGGSTVVARGDSVDGTGWPVLLPPTPATRRTEWLLDEALSTSGSYEQTFEVDGQPLCHILDPRSGRPTQRVGTVSAIARGAVLAEAVSTALFLLEGAPVQHLCAATGARACT